MSETVTSYSATTTAYGGLTAMDQSTDAPYVLIAGGTATAEKETDDFNLKATVQAWVGDTNQLPSASSPQGTPLRGIIGKLPYFMNRSPIGVHGGVDVGQHFGINDLVFSANYKSSGITASVAGASQIEKAYPYIHNAATQAGSHPINNNASIDANSPADLFNPKIGPAVLLSWKPTFLEGAEIYAQAGTAGSDVLDFGKTFKTLTAKYTVGGLDGEGQPQIAGNNVQLNLAGYYMGLDPDSATDADGNKVGSSSGTGVSVSAQVKDVADVSVGYATNHHVVTKADGDLGIDYSGLNLSTALYLGDKGVLHLAYSTLSSMENWNKVAKIVGKESALVASVTLPFQDKKAALVAEYQAVLVEQGAGQNRSVFGLTFNRFF